MFRLQSSWINTVVLLFVLSVSIEQQYHQVEADDRNRNSFNPVPYLRRYNNNNNNNNNHNNNDNRPWVRDSCKNNYKFDYIQLALIWGPGYCSTSPKECRRVENTQFTIHGMWPTITDTQQPSNCCFENTFVFDTLRPILPELEKNWPASYGESRGFWSHEWLKHGTCSRDISSLSGEFRYFNTTMNTFKKLQVLETLKKSNIIPVDGKPYFSSDIVKAMQSISKGKTIQIACDFEHHQPTPVITGLNICFDAHLEPADCPEMKRKCQRSVIFPNSATTFKK